MPVEVTGQEVTAFSYHMGPTSAMPVFPGAGVPRPEFPGSCFPPGSVLCPCLNTREDPHLEILQIQYRPRLGMAGRLAGRMGCLGVPWGVGGAAGDSGERREGGAME